MDDPALDETAHRRALAGLLRLDRAARAERLLWPALLALPHGDGPLRVLDVGCGGGEPAVPLLLRARRAGLPLELTAFDRSPRALAVSAERARRHGLPVQGDEPAGPHAAARPTGDATGCRLLLRRGDALVDLPEAGYDVVMCSLFLHHLSDADAIALLSRMKRAARRLVLVQDLRRGRRGWLIAALASRLLTRSPVVRHDALASVESAFTPAELGFLAGRAGLDSLHGRVDVRWPERLLLRWERP